MELLLDIKNQNIDSLFLIINECIQELKDKKVDIIDSENPEWALKDLVYNKNEDRFEFNCEVAENEIK